MLIACRLFSVPSRVHDYRYIFQAVLVCWGAITLVCVFTMYYDYTIEPPTDGGASCFTLLSSYLSHRVHEQLMDLKPDAFFSANSTAVQLRPRSLLFGLDEATSDWFTRDDVQEPRAAIL